MAETKEKPGRGTLVREGGRYFMEIEGLRQELTVGFLTDENALQKAVGTEFDLIYTEPIRHVIAFRTVEAPFVKVLCYRAAVKWVEKSLMTDPSVIKRVAKSYLDAGVITRRQHERIIAKRPAVKKG
jgi:hypothetical protein